MCRKIMKALKEIPNSTWERVEQSTGKRGTSDIIGVIRGLSYRIEAKTDEFNIEKPKPREVLQIHNLGRHAKMGGASFIFTESNWKHHVRQIKLWEKRQGEKR